MEERFYPVFMKIHGKRCVVVGGGKVAERKIISLLRDQAEVTVVSPQITAVLQELVEQQAIDWMARKYQRGDLSGAFIVYAATNSREVNGHIAGDAKTESVLVNVIDDPDACDFIVPSRLERGKLQIAVSTSGASPGLNKRICEELERQFGNEYEILLEWLQILRIWLQANVSSEKERRQILADIVQSSILELLRANEIEQAKQIIHSRIAYDSLL